MWTSLSTNSLCSRSPPRSPPRSPRSRLGSRAMAFFFPLEFQSALARRISQRLDASVIEIAAAVEHDVLDALLHGALRHELADGLGGIDVGAGLQASPH